MNISGIEFMYPIKDFATEREGWWWAVVSYEPAGVRRIERRFARRITAMRVESTLRTWYISGIQRGIEVANAA